MSRPIITVEGLGKRYRIGAVAKAGPRAPAPWWRRPFESMSHVFSPPLQNEELWALKDISFDVQRGEVVGLIGRNGAGKSTLLKILSRITEPSEGRAELRGRVASLLEVGTGFHGDLTGRENIFLSGAILGMHRAEITRKFDEIVAFAEVERFIDTPVKYYSSGMYVRLAFAVAAHLEPEILLVDEVLAVGDAAFQKKCLGKMGDVATAGRTILFVSHNMTAVENLCPRVLWLHDGGVRREGPAKEVIGRYLEASYTAQTLQVWEDIRQAPGNEIVRLHRACVRPAVGELSAPITVKTPFVLEFDYWDLRGREPLRATFNLYNQEGVLVFAAGIPQVVPMLPAPGVGLYRCSYSIPGDLLNDGRYRVRFHIMEEGLRLIFWTEDILVFDVAESAALRAEWFGKWSGVVRPALECRTQLLDNRLPPRVRPPPTPSDGISINMPKGRDF